MTHFTGMILATLRDALRRENAANANVDRVTIENHQQNGSYGVHQATVKLGGDPTTYRLILAPADAPITINGHPIGEHFALPLGYS